MEKDKPICSPNAVEVLSTDTMVASPQLRVGSYSSRSLGKRQEYSYYLPRNCDSWGPQRYPVLILLHGRECDHRSWARYTRIGKYLAAYGIIVVFPSGDEGWYTNSYDGAEKYEDDIVKDLAAEVLRALPALPPGRNWAIGGMSMGGYGAIKLALKHPGMFTCGFSHGGALDGMFRPGVHPIFGDPQREASFRIRESPVWLVEQALSSFPVLRPHLYLDCGTDDPLLQVNRAFSSHLTFLGYYHNYSESPGHHAWPYWNRAFRTVLPHVAALIGAEPLL